MTIGRPIPRRREVCRPGHVRRPLAPAASGVIHRRFPESGLNIGSSVYQIASHSATIGQDAYKLVSFSKSKGKFRMKRIAVLTLLVALGAGWSVPIEARDTGAAKSDGQTD